MGFGKILIVDDDRVFNRILSKKSHDMGWSAHSAFTASEAMTFLKNQKLLEMRRIKQTEQEIGDQLLDHPLVGKSPQTQKLIREISQVANSDATVLLRGETGTGKGLVAQIIHLLSHRKAKDFIPIN